MRPMLGIRLLILTVLLPMPTALWAQQTPPAGDDPAGDGWPPSYEAVEIVSSADGTPQPAMFRASTAPTPQPLVVHLHSWSADWRQLDSTLVADVAARDWSYIHPDIRGPNNTPAACCSDLVVADIEDAVRYARTHADVDPARVYVVGSSGGGYATLCAFMRADLDAAAYGAWVPISDLEAWHDESAARGNRYAGMIRACTGATDGSPDDTLDRAEAHRRSPLHQETPTERLQTARLALYAGVRDGVDGSVPITHSLGFYNKVLRDLGVPAAEAYASDGAVIRLLTTRGPIGETHAPLGGREVFFARRFGNVQVVIFDGGHEMLQHVALDELAGR